MRGKKLFRFLYVPILVLYLLFFVGLLWFVSSWAEGFLKGLSSSSMALNAGVEKLQSGLILVGVITLLVLAGVGFLLARSLSNSLRKLQSWVNRLSQGDEDAKAPAPDSGLVELQALGQTLRQRASQDQEKIQTLSQQRQEQEVLLSSMLEGVLAVDNEERLIRLNRAAARLFGVSQPEQALGASLQEVIRNSALQKFAARTLSSTEAIEDELILYQEGGQQVLQGHGTLLRDNQGFPVGALIVLNDITRLKHLESMRQEFVSNVSHELKTPITSIKGFIETLREGAIERPAEARRFLDIVARQTDRLNALIEDLLSLSRLEQESRQGEIALERSPLKPVLLSAIKSCEARAQEKGLTLHLMCPEDLIALLNPLLLEQALVNLIDNAVKYSEKAEIPPTPSLAGQVFPPKTEKLRPPGQRQGTIEVRASQTAQEIVVEVQDWGCGIEKLHLPRLFERFYRVDKARSRKLGGTGLGLAIVKHIALAHHGTVGVESAPGQGSTFSIHLPLSSP